MNYLNETASVLLGKGAFNTAREITNQPKLWNLTSDKFFLESHTIQKFLQDALRESDQVILTGAGTSAFIGLSLQGSFSFHSKKITRAVATTDLVSHPKYYFQDDKTPLIISFARSGNSPESCAALEVADSLCKKCFHLVITCNADGALANYKSSNPSCIFVLPDEANDKGLAMTGSYSSMLLSGLLLIYSENKAFCLEQIHLLTGIAKKILTKDREVIQQIAGKTFSRAVFLGSGPLFGTAKEASLKLQELTDGQIICQADTYLGFRHGPKAVIDETTLVVYFFSNDEYVLQYETDLLAAMKTGNSALFHLGISEQRIDTSYLHEQLILGIDDGHLSEDFLPVCSIIPGQLLGYYNSLKFGLFPDEPSISGSISRVVEGVNIYPVLV